MGHAKPIPIEFDDSLRDDGLGYAVLGTRGRLIHLAAWGPAAVTLCGQHVPYSDVHEQMSGNLCAECAARADGEDP